MAVIIRNKKQLQEAKETLADLKKARKKILVGAQSYTLGEQQITRANLAEIAREIEVYEAAIDAFETYGTSQRRAVRVVPL
ncbi:MAG: DUF6148 family protein [Firmicutes bacterium]|nr:DUF6148 family protein [Bacillota bacterium]